MFLGVVVKSTGNLYRVKLEDGSTVECTVRGKLRLKGSKTTNPLTVGDRVNVETSHEGTAVIVDILPRTNYIIRRSTNLSRESHIIAANIDQAILVVTIIQPETQTAFIDRYLVTSEAYSIPAILVFNKVDILNAAQTAMMNQFISIYEEVGYKCLCTSATTGYNLDAFRQLLQGKTSLISGNSGVGKSSLINAIEPTLQLKTSSISAAHLKGKHTTTFSEMFELSFGGYVIDTPGIKGFGIIDIDKKELYHYFPEIFRLKDKCRFYNCTHVHEPGCAVIEAVESGTISQSRYMSYLSIYFDENSKYR